MVRNLGIIIVIIGMFVLSGCSNDPVAPLATATPVTASTAVIPPVPTAAPQVTAATGATISPAAPAAQSTGTMQVGATGSYTSTGLGITRTEWEKEVGKPSSDMGSTMAGYQDSKYVVIYWGPKPGNIIEIVRQFPTSTTATMKQAQDEAHALLPADAEFVKNSTETITGTNVVVTNQLEVYHSTSLPVRYPTWLDTKFDWHNAAVGDIVIAYLYNEKGVLYAWQMDAGATQK